MTKKQTAIKTRAKAPKQKKKATRTADEWLDRIMREFLPRLACTSFFDRKLDDVTAGEKLLEQPRETQAAVVANALTRVGEWEEKLASLQSQRNCDTASCSARYNADWHKLWIRRWVLEATLRALLRRELPLTETVLLRLVRWPETKWSILCPGNYPLASIIGSVENFVASHGPTQALQRECEALIARLRESDRDKQNWKLADRLDTIIAGGPRVRIHPGEAWADAAIANLQKLAARLARPWNELLIHCQAKEKEKTAPHWRREAEVLVNAVGFSPFKDHVLRWFPLVDRPRTQRRERRHAWDPDYDHLIIDPHVELLRGVVLRSVFREDADLARALMRLAISCYRKVPRKGPRLVSLGNACITALGRMPGLAPIGQLAVLKVKVKSGTAQKQIEKAFRASAEREGLPSDDVEELAVPAYGLESVGQLHERFGEYQLDLMIDGVTATMHWSKQRKPLKSMPAAVKKEHADEVKELQSAVKDMNSMLPAQRERIDLLFLHQKRWPLALWRERYLDHPLIGTIARRIIWSFTRRGETVDGMWWQDQLRGLDGKPLRLNGDPAVTLWHPIGNSTDTIIAWREWLEKREIVQPFKQAHREVYILTDAERRTRLYSNRFAAHLLRQHQFHALCLARGWKNYLRLMVDTSYPPTTRLLPTWNLRAEFWIEGAGLEDERVNASGTYLYLSTDQVRFYQLNAAQLTAHAVGGRYEPRWDETEDEPLPLESIPRLVFSEILRDVDLFVGVASVGSDPNWSDERPQGRYRDYWQSYSFGELSATAQTRRTLLERLIPRLRIAGQCSLDGRFLVVRGSLRTYKIHLGSGNILMSPNDQFLCIVPKQAMAVHDRVFLPFEGDGTLSTILSKAFLLADDSGITDPVITSQLKSQ